MKTICANMAIIDESLAIIQPLDPEWYHGKVSGMDMLRLDRIHPVISGNKWYKLKYNLEKAKQAGYKRIITFGGAYSNHLIATAAAAKQYNLKSAGFIKGRYAEKQLTETLLQCRASEMELYFITNEEYKQKGNKNWLEQLSAKFPDIYIIPEGGANELGRTGAGDIAQMIKSDYTHVCISVGSGTTFAGLRNVLPGHQVLLGFVPMKNGNYMQDEIIHHINPDDKNNWQLFDSWHFSGFGKWNDILLDFMNSFYKHNNIPLDVVYTAKMMFGLQELIKTDFFEKKANILCIHTGGLQGNTAIQDKLLY